MEKIIITGYNSPVGEMILGTFNGQICLCDWSKSKRRPSNERSVSRNLNASYEEGDSSIIDKLKKELDDYFSGECRDFSVRVLSIGTKFQRQVWSELEKIPYGSTITYGELARRIGKPKAVRAVASAVAANPLSILVPCHRVVGSNGRLTGYAGGLFAKKTLLSLENTHIDD